MCKFVRKHEWYLVSMQDKIGEELSGLAIKYIFSQQSLHKYVGEEEVRFLYN